MSGKYASPVSGKYASRVPSYTFATTLEAWSRCSSTAGNAWTCGVVYPEREGSAGVSMRAQGQEAVLTALDAWQMENIYKGESQ